MEIVLVTFSGWAPWNVQNFNYNKFWAIHHYILDKQILLIYEADPQSQLVVITTFTPVVCTSVLLSIRKSISTFQNTEKQTKVQARVRVIVIITDSTVGLANWIIDDMHVLLYLFIHLIEPQFTADSDPALFSHMSSVSLSPVFKIVISLLGCGQTDRWMDRQIDTVANTTDQWAPMPSLV